MGTKSFCLWLAVVLLAASRVLANDLTPVVLQLKWKHQFQFAGYYAAKELGYYRDAGFDVTLLEAGPGVNPVNEVLSGRADYGVANAELLLYHLSGEPVVALAVIFQHSPLVLFSLKSSGINTPHDLAGKRVMFPDGAYGANTRGLLLKEGVDLSQVEQVPLSFDLTDLVNGTVDAMVGYVTDKPYLLDQQNIAYSIIKPRQYGVDFYGDTLFTRRELVDQQFEAVTRFRNASIKGWQYALNHPQEVIEIIKNQYNSERTRAELWFEAQKSKELIFPDLVDLGHMNPGRWQHIADVFKTLELSDGVLEPDRFLFDPEVHALSVRNQLLWRSLAIGLVIALGLFAVLVLMNKHLKRLVREKTMTLEMANQHLTGQTEALQKKDSILVRLNKELEQRVQARTKELETKNLALAEEISHRREKEISLQLLSKALEYSRSLVVIVNDQGCICYLNEAFQEFMGYPPRNFEGLSLEELEPYINFPAVDEDSFFSTVKNRQRIELCGYDANRALHWFQVTTSPLFTSGSSPSHFVFVCEDVTGIRQRQGEMEKMAFYDSLTGLENRVMFNHSVNQALSRLKREHVRCAVLFIDLDHFKAINDQYGHAYGDITLITIANRIRGLVRETDSVARISGDEFAVLILNIHSKEDAALIAEKILEEAIKPIVHQSQELFVSASIGICLAPDDANTAKDLLSYADLAMYESKRGGRNCYHFYSSDDSARSAALGDNNLSDTVCTDAMMLSYLPTYDLKTRQLFGFDCIPRLLTPQKTIEFNKHFIELPSFDKIMPVVVPWLIERLHESRKEMNRMGMENTRFGLRLSEKQVEGEDHCEMLDLLAASDLDLVGQVQLLISEKTLIKDISGNVELLRQWIERGFDLVIDDVASTEHLFSYLKRLKIAAIRLSGRLIG